MYIKKQKYAFKNIINKTYNATIYSGNTKYLTDNIVILIPTNENISKHELYSNIQFCEKYACHTNHLYVYKRNNKDYDHF